MNMLKIAAWNFNDLQQRAPETKTFLYKNIRSSHKFVPTFVYTFHVSIYKHTAIRDQRT